MPKRKLGSRDPEGVLSVGIDLEAVKQEAIRRTESEMPEAIKRMTPEECKARLGDYGRGLVKRLTARA